MFLIRFMCLVAIICINTIHSIPAELFELKDHFIANLLEENRAISSLELTSEIEKSINQKINGFLETISAPSKRALRDTNDLLLNEKTANVFILKGFDSRGHVPINFPQDICMFRIKSHIFAVGLSYGKLSNETSMPSIASTKTRTMTIFLRREGKFKSFYEYQSANLKAIDCQTMGDAGYVAVVNTINTNDNASLSEIGSFVLRVTMQESDKPAIEIFQKFAIINQNAVRLWWRDQNMYLIYSYDTNNTSPLNVCTIYKLTETFFNPIDNLPCQNAKVIEFFTVHHNLFIFIGNHHDNSGSTSTFSSIMRYDLELKSFVEYQKIHTNAVGVGRYFYLDHRHQRQHFLFVGNTFEIDEFGSINYNVPSMMYKYVNGFFIPLQTIIIKHIQDALPVIGKNGEFHLLISSTDREVQIYFYDGWKFQESPVDFTGDSFGSGVVSMRSYEDIINGTSTIVIANHDAFGRRWNIFTPIYAKRNDSSQIKTNIRKWCSHATERIESFNVNEIDDILKASTTLVDAASSESANFKGKLFIRNSTIGTIRANQLKGTTSIFNNSTMNKIISINNRLDVMSNNIQKLNNKIKFTMATRSRVRRQSEPSSIVNDLIVDEQINVETINGRSIDDLVYTFSSRNQRLTEIVAKEVTVVDELFVNDKIDGIEFTIDNVLLNVTRQVLRSASLNQLNVSRIGNNVRFNTMQFSDFFTLLKRKVDKKIPNMINELKVDTLELGRFLNNRNFTAMSINSMKIDSDQVVSGSLDIDSIKANRVLFLKGPKDPKISGIPLTTLININDTAKRVVIEQDLRFDSDLSINRLFIIERINNINVKEGQLQVLRKRGPVMQVVTGEKTFDVVNLKEPIVLQGKIESKTLEKMNPIATINRNIILQGDYSITGPVTIRRALNVTGNVSTTKPDLNLKRLMNSGLNLFTSISTKSKLVFQNIVEVKGNLQAGSLNSQPVEAFVKTNVKNQQIVKGVITFTNGLLVDNGFVHANIINDVDLIQLNSTILKMSSNVTQSIDGNIEMKGLRAQLLVTPIGQVKVNGQHLETILNTNEFQEITSMNVNVAKARSLSVIDMKQAIGAKIFESDLNFIIGDAIKKDSPVSTIIAEKTFNELSVSDLKFTEINEWKEIIASYDQIIAQDLNLTGNQLFSNQMRIKNLQISGTINEISFEDFIENVLFTEGDQTFTAPQNFTSISIEKNVELTDGTINNANIGRMMNESIWIDEPQNFDIVKVEGELLVRGHVTAPLVNGIELERKLLLNNTNDRQKINLMAVEKAKVEFLNFVYLNGIDCAKLMETFDGADGAPNLFVKGGVKFNNYQPAISFLNNVNLHELFENVWLSNRDVILTGEDIQFLAMTLIDDVIYSDFLNGKDLVEFNQRYFSLSKIQSVATTLQMKGAVLIKNKLNAEKMIITGYIKRNPTDREGFKIEFLAQNVLRHNISQTITGTWNFKKLHLYGDYDGTINGFNIADDILHTGILDSAEITGAKSIHSVHANHVYTSMINSIDLVEWLSNAVLLNTTDEQTIEGKITFGQSMFDNGLTVDGQVNGMNLNYQTVFTKSNENQVLNGDLTIHIIDEKLSKGRSFFVENLQLQNGINGKDITDIYENVLKANDTIINSSKLIFDNKLLVGSVVTSKSIYDVDMGKFLKGSDASTNLVKFQKNLEYLTTIGHELIESFKDVAEELSHFEHVQSLHGAHIQRSVPFIIKSSPLMEYGIAVHERHNNISKEIIKFYRWNREQNLFVIDPILEPLQYDYTQFVITRLNKVIYNSIDHLFLELFNRQTKAFSQKLLLCDLEAGNVLPMLDVSSLVSTKFITLFNGRRPCYGSLFPTLQDISIICDGAAPLAVSTLPIRMVSSQNEILILLSDDHQLQIWKDMKLVQVLKILKPESFASIYFNGKYYLAVCSDKVEQSIHHGSIEIFESNDEINFIHVQSIELDYPMKIQFSILPTGDVMMYVLTRNPSKTLGIFMFAGVSYFVERVGSSTIVSPGSDLNTIQIDGKFEFLSIVSGEIYLIQAVLNEY